MSTSTLKRKQDESSSDEDMPDRKVKKVELILYDMDPKIMDSMIKDIYKAALKWTNNHALAITIANATQKLRYGKILEINIGLILEENTKADLYEYESSTDEADYSSSEDDSVIDASEIDDSEIDEKSSFSKMEARIDKILKR